MIKIRFYYDKDKEIEWLNAMSAQGWKMKRFFMGCYWFEKCQEQEYAYQIDFGVKLFHKYREYREFLQEMNIEIVQRWGPWVILRKAASDGKFEFYTDAESRISQYYKIRKMFKMVCIIDILALFVEALAATQGVSVAYLFFVLILALLLGLIHVVSKITNIIIELEERGGGVSKLRKNTEFSMLLPIGCILVGLSVLFMELLESDMMILHLMRIIAIVLIIVGTFLTFRKRANG